MHTHTQLSVFEKFGGIRPMASALGIAHSTVKAWHYARSIPAWRHDSILAAATREGISLSAEELVSILPDSELMRRGAPRKNREQSTPGERAA